MIEGNLLEWADGWFSYLVHCLLFCLLVLFLFCWCFLGNFGVSFTHTFITHILYICCHFQRKVKKDFCCLQLSKYHSMFELLLSTLSFEQTSQDAKVVLFFFQIRMLQVKPKLIGSIPAISLFLLSVSDRCYLAT